MTHPNLKTITLTDRTHLYKAHYKLLEGLYSSFFRHKSQRIGCETKSDSRERGHYYFIPMSPHVALMSITAAVRVYKHMYEDDTRIAENPKFLDCGAGLGNIMLLAAEAGCDSYGIEYDPVNVKEGRQLLKFFDLSTWRLIQGDLMEFQDFSSYDIIYGYCPMCDPAMESKFERRLCRMMKPNSILIGLKPRGKGFQSISVRMEEDGYDWDIAAQVHLKGKLKGVKPWKSPNPGKK